MQYITSHYYAFVGFIAISNPLSHYNPEAKCFGTNSVDRNVTG